MEVDRIPLRLVRIGILLSVFVAFRYYLLMPDVSLKVPVLEWLPSPFSDYSELIFWLALFLVAFLMFREARLRRRFLLKELDENTTTEDN